MVVGRLRKGWQLMGVKSKVRSMQRGALLRSDEAPVTNADLYKVSPPLLTDKEIAHFQFGNRSINDFFLGLSDILKACHHNHLAAADISKVLNKQNARTACGQAWTPRLAWFLMKTWRTVYFNKLEQARESKRAAERKSLDSTAADIERSVARQQAHAFQKVLRNYFKNPTLGEIFPELGALKQTLLSGLKEVPAVQSNDRHPTIDASSTPPSAKLRKPDNKNRNSSKRVTSASPDSLHGNPVPLQFTGVWDGFFQSAEGRRYLAALVRSHPRLLELAPQESIRFLGCLRAKKAAHPGERYWSEDDAEQVRLAIAAGLHRLHNW